MISNIQLWFAREGIDGEIVVASNASLEKEYFCPICESKVVPKGTKDKSKVTPHFAHVDKDKCNSESMVHWWFKNKLIEVGDKFRVKEKKVMTYIAKDIKVENIFTVNGVKYKPDLTIETECGKRIHFEMAYTNKKTTEDYIGVWSSLGDVVVEVEIQNLMDDVKEVVFNAIFFDGNLRDKRKRSSYKSNVEDYIDRKFKDNRNKEEIERIKKLNWMWTDICRYKDGKLSVGDLVVSIDNVDIDDREFVCNILDKKFCQDISSDIVKYKVKQVCHILKDRGIDVTYNGDWMIMSISKTNYETSKVIDSSDTIDEIVSYFNDQFLKSHARYNLRLEVDKLIKLLNSYYDDVYITYLEEFLSRNYRYMPMLSYRQHSDVFIVCNLVDAYGCSMYRKEREIKINIVDYQNNKIDIVIGDNIITCSTFDLCFKRKDIAKYFNELVKDIKHEKNARMWGMLPYETR